MDSLILGLRVLVALGAVLGLMWFLQRRLGKGKGRRRAGGTLSVVSRQAVGQKASVVVVDAGGRRFLLGVTEHSINVLHAGDAPAEPLESPTAERPVPQAAPLPRSAPGPRSPLEPQNVPAGAGSFAAAFQEATGMPRRSEVHRPGANPTGSNPPASALHGSILAGSTWRQAAEALRGRRN